MRQKLEFISQVKPHEAWFLVAIYYLLITDY